MIIVGGCCLDPNTAENQDNFPGDWRWRDSELDYFVDDFLYFAAGRCCYSDTWEFDGKSWDHFTGPTPRTSFYAVSDSDRGRLLVYGGLQRKQAFCGSCDKNPDEYWTPETWEWNGSRWSLIERDTPPIIIWDSAPVIPFPLPRLGPAAPTGSAIGGGWLIYDSGRKRPFLYDSRPWVGGGWEWNGQYWVPRRTSSEANPSAIVAMTYDESRHRVLALGNGTDAPESPSRAQIWELEGDTWIKRDVRDGPSEAVGAVMSYDSARRRSVLFGEFCCVDGETVKETWEWNGTAWERIDTAALPSHVGPVTFDPTVAKTVMMTDGQLWEFDGLNWTQALVEDLPWYAVGPILFDYTNSSLVVIGKDLRNIWRLRR